VLTFEILVSWRTRRVGKSLNGPQTMEWPQGEQQKKTAEAKESGGPLTTTADQSANGALERANKDYDNQLGGGCDVVMRHEDSLTPPRRRSRLCAGSVGRSAAERSPSPHGWGRGRRGR
jgi:hypothetical protein